MNLHDAAFAGNGYSVEINSPNGHVVFFFPFNPDDPSDDQPARDLIESVTQYVYESGWIMASDGKHLIAQVAI